MKYSHYHRYSILIIFFLLLSCSSPIIIPQHSETLSQSIHATKDSLDLERVDLAYKYASASAILVPVPKNKILISPIIKTKLSGERERSIIVPESYKGKNVVVVGSIEWDGLLLEANNSKIYKEDLEKYQNITTELTKEIQRQMEAAARAQKLIDDMKLEISELKAKLLKYKFLIFGTVTFFIIWQLIKIKLKTFPL